MKKLIPIFFFAISIIACGDSEQNDSSKTAATTSKPKKKVDGQKVYKTYCITCHGLNGDMGASGAHDLTQSTLSVEERIEVIANGRNTMTPFKDLLSDEKIKAVAEYTGTLKKEE